MDKLIADFTADKFANYEKLELAPGMTMDNIEEALGFIVIHESVHHGNIITLRRLLGVK